MSTPPAHKPLIRSNGLDEFSGLVLSGFEVKKIKQIQASSNFTANIVPFYIYPMYQTLIN